MMEIIYNEIGIGFMEFYEVEVWVYKRNGVYQEHATIFRRKLYSSDFRIDEILIDIGLDVGATWELLDISETDGYKADIRKLIITEH